MLVEVVGGGVGVLVELVVVVGVVVVGAVVVELVAELVVGVVVEEVLVVEVDDEVVGVVVGQARFASADTVDAPLAIAVLSEGLTPDRLLAEVVNAEAARTAAPQ